MSVGRVGGIEDMTPLMTPNRHELSENFKTANYHSYQQAVTTNDMSAKGTEVYVNIARKVIISNNGLSEEEANDDKASLFLTCNGHPEYQMGKSVTDFFKSKSEAKLQLHSTSIRSLYETTANDLYENGTITLAHKNAVTTLGGHNGATVHKYCLKRRLENSVKNAQAVMSVVYNNNSTPASVPDSGEPPALTSGGSESDDDIAPVQIYDDDVAPPALIPLRNFRNNEDLLPALVNDDSDSDDDEEDDSDKNT